MDRGARGPRWGDPPRRVTRTRPQRVVEYERGFGKVGLLALVVQLVTGVWLANIWLGGWSSLFRNAPPAAPFILIKLGIVSATLLLAGHAYHRLLPRLDADHMRSFVVHAWATTVLAVLGLMAGASIRLGGLF